MAEMVTAVVGLAVLGMPVSALCFTVTSAAIFEVPRGWVARHSPGLGKLVSCPYCFSHWVAAAVVWWLGVRGAMLFALELFTLVWWAAIWTVLLSKAYYGRDLKLIRAARAVLDQKGSV